MDHVSEVIPAQISSVKSSQELFDDEQRERVNKFFALIRVGWGAAKFNSQFGDAQDVQHTKRFYARRILQYTPAKLAEAVEMAVDLRAGGDADFLFPDVAKILGLIGKDWESKRLHKPYDPNAVLPDLGEGRLLPWPEDNRSREEIVAEMRSWFA